MTTNMSSTSKLVTNSTWEPLRLTHTKPSFNNHELALAARQDLWHKFIIFDAADYEKEIILDAIMTICQPEVLLPIMYRVDRAKKGTFLAKCSIAAIETLVRQGFQIQLSEGHIIKMDIVLGFINMNELQINPHRIIADVIVSRWDPLKKYLNLEDFENIKELSPIYCPLSSPGVFVFVLRCCKMRIGNPRDNKLPIKELNLRNNKLQGVMLYEKLINYNLVKLDLRFNNIENLDYLRYFTEFKITELWLDGNPICTQFTTAEDYIQAVKHIFPQLQKLDGAIVDQEQKCIPITHSYYLGDGKHLSLIKQFVKHYFTLFDQKDRNVLHGLYESDAFFSATVGDIANPRHRQLTKLININRNLLKVVDYSRCYKYLIHGSNDIIECLRRIPPTFHDYKNYNVDLIYQGNNHLVISIQGSFFYREFPISLLFNRTFIIIEKEGNEYQIVNDQYHIQSGFAMMLESNNAKLGLNQIPEFIPTIMSEGEKNDLLKFLSNVSTMNSRFCRIYLEKANWDLRAAIANFIKAYTVNDISPKAFEIID